MHRGGVGHSDVQTDAANALEELIEESSNALGGKPMPTMLDMCDDVANRRNIVLSANRMNACNADEVSIIANTEVIPQPR